MASLLLPIIEYNADYELARAVPLVLEGRMPRDRMHNVWQAYRRRGICALLLHCDVEGLHTDLQRSAAFFAFYLEHLADVETLATSEAVPFFDALACRDRGTVRAIAQHARASWNEGYEYEDDFLYTYILMMMASDAAPDGLKPLFTRFEVVLAGQGSVRYDVCLALRLRDSARFEAAMERLVAVYEAGFLDGRADGHIPEETWATDGCLFVEGLALVALAEQYGLHSSPDYLYIPSLARRAADMVHDPQVWRLP